jgi:hypothetical protein
MSDFYVLLSTAERQGYSADQVQRTITLSDLQEQIARAVADFGPDARIIIDNGERYGARFGGLDPYNDVFTEPEFDEEEIFA